MITGTSHFLDLAAARKYYKDYVPGYTRTELAKYVNIMIANGSISIGPPKFDPKTQKIFVNSEGRYHIEDIEPKGRIVIPPSDGPGPINETAIEHIEHVLCTTIYLPDDFGHGWDYSLVTTGENYCETYHNLAHDTLWQEMKPTETLCDPGNAMVWARFEIKSSAEIPELKRRILELAERFPVRDDEHAAYIEHKMRNGENAKSFEEWKKERDDE